MTPKNQLRYVRFLNYSINILNSYITIRHFDNFNNFQLIKVEHNYCFVPRVSPPRNNQVNGVITQNVSSGQTCIVSPTVSQIQSQPQYNVVSNNNRGKLK